MSLMLMVTNLQNSSSIHNIQLDGLLYGLVTNLQNSSSIHNWPVVMPIEELVTNLQNSSHNDVNENEKREKVTNLQNSYSIHNPIIPQTDFLSCHQSKNCNNFIVQKFLIPFGQIFFRIKIFFFLVEMQ